MLKIDKYIYMYHRNNFSSNHLKILKAQNVVYTSLSDNNKFREQINIRYSYYTNTYAELI